MAKHTLKKFVRGESTPGRLRIQPRDAALIRDFASFRFLNTAQILALRAGSKGHFQHRLTSLYQLGYVDRPEGQKAFNLPSDHIIYSLGKKGAELAFPDERDRKLWARLNAKISSPNLEHALMVSQFRIVLTLALQTHGGKITRWLQGYELKDKLTLRGRLSPAIVPDGFFTIDVGDGLYHFFLEADRSKMNHRRFLEKLRAYWDWWRDKTYNEWLDITKFRVLTITDTEGRKENLRVTSKEADTRREGSNMFLFACEKDYSLKNPKAVLEAIWASPKGGSKHSLLE